MSARRATGLVSLVCLLALGGVVHDDVARGAQGLFAPAYDTVTRSSLHNLATALQSYALMEGDLSRLTLADLAEWGWAPGDTTQVTIWVSGDEFRAVAQDVRPGASAYQATGGADAEIHLTLLGEDTPTPDTQPMALLDPGLDDAEVTR